ncbi:MAG: hypothetical protein HRT37_14555 [Alteromonadaceae bacterium]|nr:hypothetical protein [Alteromonadaceae bacterium]
MFLDKFLENIFSNSLKDKQGPSFVYIYILTWLVINYPYIPITIQNAGFDSFKKHIYCVAES